MGGVVWTGLNISTEEPLEVNATTPGLSHHSDPPTSGKWRTVASRAIGKQPEVHNFTPRTSWLRDSERSIGERMHTRKRGDIGHEPKTNPTL